MMEQSTHSQVKQQPDWLDQVIIRRLRQSDLPALEWDGEYTHFRAIYQNAYERSLMGQSVLWVAEHQGHGVIGQLFIQLDSDVSELADGSERAYLHAFRIRPEYRCEGLGSFMMKVVEADLVRRAFKVVTLNITQDNHKALRLYKRLGYRVTGPGAGQWSYPDHNGVWQTVNEPSWRMEKLLGE
ncbi:MAG: GNAT family N-acetyltransferase [Anaerolineaceae bacterium]|nr:GNAT family N-acetyltransferase [Anaerolineaceae bacterium]